MREYQKEALQQSFFYYFLSIFVNASQIVSLLQQYLVQYRTVILYFIIGASASLIDLVGFYVGHTYFGLVSPLATTYSVILATVYAFLLNAFFNFKQTDRLFVRLLSYSLVSGIGLLISAFMLYILNVRMGFDGNLIKILSLPVVFVVQYLLNKRITFQTQKS